MTWLPEAIAGGSTLLGMLGGHDDKAAKSTANANNAADRLGDVSNWYTTRAGTADKFATGERNDQQTAYDKLKAQYATDPTNDAAYARDLARANNGLETNIAKAEYDNLANPSQVPGAAPSSQTAGMNTYLQGLEALGISGHQVDVANSNQATRVKNMQDSYGLSTGQYGQDESIASKDTGASASIQQQLEDYYARQAASEQAQQNLEQSQETGDLGTLGGFLGKYAAGLPKSATTTPASPVGGGFNPSGVPQTGGGINYNPNLNYNPTTGRFG